MSFAQKVQSTGKESSLPIIETTDDFLAFAGLRQSTVRLSTGSAFVQVIDLDYNKGELTMKMGDVIANRLPAFFEKNGITFEVKDGSTKNTKDFTVTGLDSWRKLAVWGVSFVGADVLRDQHAASQNQQAAVARSA